MFVFGFFPRSVLVCFGFFSLLCLFKVVLLCITVGRSLCLFCLCFCFVFFCLFFFGVLFYFTFSKILYGFVAGLFVELCLCPEACNNLYVLETCLVFMFLLFLKIVFTFLQYGPTVSVHENQL